MNSLVTSGQCLSNLNQFLGRGLRLTWAFLAFAAGLLSAAERDEKGWFRYGNDEFEILGINRDSDHEEFAMRYQVYLDTFDSYFARDGLPAPRALILSMPTRREFAELMGTASQESGMTSLGGFVEIDGDGGTVLNFSRIHPESQLGATVYLELEWRMRRYGWYLPPWISQGVGAVFAFSQFQHRGALDVGSLPFDLRRWNETHLLDWDRFFAAGRPDLAKMTPRERGQYWAQSWGLVRWWVFRSDDPRARMEELTALTDRSATPAELLAYFGLSAEALTAEVLRYAGERDYERFRFDPEVVDRRMQFEALSTAESEALLADILLASGDLEGAEARLNAALAASDRPLPLPLLLADARRCLMMERRAEAVARYREAMERGTDSPFAWLVSAEERVFALEATAAENDRESWRAEWEAAEREARRAIALDPSNGRAYNVLGRVALLADAVEPVWIDLMRQRVGADLWGARVRGYLGILLAKAGRQEDAVAELTIAARNPELNDGERHATLQRLAAVQAYLSGDRGQLFASVRDAVNDLLGQGNVADALALLERTVAKTEDAGLREQFAALAVEIEANVTRQMVAGLIKRQRWAEARETAETFLAKVPADSEFRAEIEGLLAQVQTM